MMVKKQKKTSEQKTNKNDKWDKENMNEGKENKMATEQETSKNIESI